ncbi:response regulator transcription factor [Roseococcus sp. YIM B11640]|uniref:response regulator transcription factor n=1 Tax=Roseococcus sp. YIM B11640 TaxID=3133973 RepID=UPI003C7E4234
MPGRKLLLVTSDAALAALLPPQLAQGTEFRADIATPEEAGPKLAEAAGRIDATLLDASAAEWAAGLREAGAGRPVILLGQAAGAPPSPDVAGVVPKPVRLAELVSRLHAVLATFDASADAAIPLGPYAFHPVGKLLRSEGGKRIRLTEKEAAILLYLHRAGGRAVPRAELLGEVWGYSDAVTTHTLETHIYRLRRKIEADPHEAQLLVTDEGGYRLGG